MARVDGKAEINPSLLDRLIDDKPELSSEPVGKHLVGVADLKRSVARDLENLFNSRQEAIQDIPPEFAELNKSLLVYGLPDVTSLNLLSSEDRSYLQRALEMAIAKFEPRLERVRVTADTPGPASRALRFRIEALLRVEPAAEWVSFDTVLEPTTHQYEVDGRS